MIVLTLGAPPPRLGAATGERVVTNRHSGLAIDGFDPVAYFTDSAPVAGTPDFEYRFAGAVWRFSNEGNRAAFTDDPEVYLPSFGGYDPVAAARGAAVPGNPLIWLVVDDRLLLFRSIEARDAFAANPQKAFALAETRWPEVLRDLVP